MGAKLTGCYAFVEGKKGVPGKMRLAMLTGVPAEKAGSTEDSAEMLAKFKKAAKEITDAEYTG